MEATPSAATIYPKASALGQKRTKFLCRVLLPCHLPSAPHVSPAAQSSDPGGPRWSRSAWLHHLSAAGSELHRPGMDEPGSVREIRSADLRRRNEVRPG